MLAASGKVVTALERDISAPAATTFVENVAQMLGLKASRVPPCATWLCMCVFISSPPGSHKTRMSIWNSSGTINQPHILSQYIPVCFNDMSRIVWGCSLHLRPDMPFLKFKWIASGLICPTRSNKCQFSSILNFWINSGWNWYVWIDFTNFGWQVIILWWQ